MADHVSLTERYRSAYYSGDFESVRGLVVEDFTFAGPAAAYRGIEDFLAASAHVPRMVRSVETQRTFSQANEVCAILTVTVDHKVERFFVVEWYRFEGDRIASIQTIFDTGPFVRRAAEDADTAVDPVCHMIVRKDAAAVTRERDGRTFYFCSPGCALGFDQVSPIIQGEMHR